MRVSGEYVNVLWSMKKRNGVEVGRYAYVF